MNDPVRNFGKGRIVGDQDDGLSRGFAGVLEQLENRLAGLVVQCARGLVAEQKLGIFCQCTRNRHALLFAAGKLGGEIAHPVAQPHHLQCLGGIKRVLADLVCQLHVLKRGQAGDQVIELEHETDVMPAIEGQLSLGELADVFALEQDLAGSAAIHAAEHIQQRGLAGSGRTNHNAQFTLFDGKAHPIQGGNLHLAHGVDLSHIVEFHKRHWSLFRKQ